MKSSIVTIFPTPSERYIAPRPALAGPALPAAEGPKLVKGAVETLPSIESVILQKLLAELEARQTTRAHPTYTIESTPPPQPAVFRRVLWCGAWLLSIVFAALAVNYIDGLRMGRNTADHESRAIEELTANLARQTDAFSSVTASLQQLAAVIGYNANGATTVPEIPPPHPAPAVTNQTPESASQPVMPVIIGNSAPDSDSSPIPMGGHIHPPIEWAVAPPNAIVHHNAIGVMDYWIMPRIVSGATVMTKVVPILQNNSGTFVHHVAEAKDYLVTPSGDWLEALDTDGKK